MDEQLKQRLIGAIIIVALVVIFVPMLFEVPAGNPGGDAGGAPALPRTLEERTIELPKSAADVVPQEDKESAPETGYRIIPLDDPPPKPAAERAPETAGAAEQAEGTAEEEYLPMEDEEPVGEEAPPGPSKATLPAPGKPARSDVPAKTGVAAKGKEGTATKSRPSPAKAPRVQPALRTAEEAGPAFEPATPKSGALPAALPKPKAAPVAKKTEPQGANQEPERSAAVPKSSVSAAWVVQAGSFTAEANARSLAEKLRQQNLPAFVEVVQGDTGSVYRVQVGPELDRARADQLQKQMQSALGIKGMVRQRP